MQAHNRYEDRNVLFVGLTAEGHGSLDESRAFVKSHGVTWPNGYGAQATLDAYGVYGYPTVFVVGPDGRIVWSGHDAASSEFLDAIEVALAQSTAGAE